MICQRLPTPVTGDVAEQSVFHFVPFARPRRKKANLNDHAKVVCEPLQFPLPQPVARSVASTTVGCNEQSLKMRVTFASQQLMPAAQGSHREFCRVRTDADANEGFIGVNVVDTVRDRLA